MSWGLDFSLMQIKSPPLGHERRDLPKAITEERLQQLGVKLDRAMRYQERKALEEEERRKHEERHKMLMKSLKEVPTRILQLAAPPKHKLLVASPPTPSSALVSHAATAGDDATTVSCPAASPPAHRPPTLRQRRQESLRQHLTRTAARTFVAARSRSCASEPGAHRSESERVDNATVKRHHEDYAQALAATASRMHSDAGAGAGSGGQSAATEQGEVGGVREATGGHGGMSVARRVRRVVGRWVYSEDEGWIRREEEEEEDEEVAEGTEAVCGEGGGVGQQGAHVPHTHTHRVADSALAVRDTGDASGARLTCRRARPLSSRAVRVPHATGSQGMRDGTGAGAVSDRPQWGWSGFRRTQDAVLSLTHGIMPGHDIADGGDGSSGAGGSGAGYGGSGAKSGRAADMPHRPTDMQRVERLARPRIVTAKFTVEKPNYEAYVRRRADLLAEPVPDCVSRLRSRASDVPCVLNLLPPAPTITVGQINQLALPLQRHARAKVPVPVHQPVRADERALRHGRQRLLARPQSGVALCRMFASGVTVTAPAGAATESAEAATTGTESSPDASSISGHARTQPARTRGSSWSQTWGSSLNCTGHAPAFPTAFPDPAPRMTTTVMPVRANTVRSRSRLADTMAVTAVSAPLLASQATHASTSKLTVATRALTPALCVTIIPSPTDTDHSSRSPPAYQRSAVVGVTTATTETPTKEVGVSVPSGLGKNPQRNSGDLPTARPTKSPKATVETLPCPTVGSFVDAERHNTREQNDHRNDQSEHEHSQRQIRSAHSYTGHKTVQNNQTSYVGTTLSHTTKSDNRNFAHRSTTGRNSHAYFLDTHLPVGYSVSYLLNQSLRRVMEQGDDDDEFEMAFVDLMNN